MPDNSKPLFSRPVLAIIMVLCTLAVWVLQLTAQNSQLPTPVIENTTTQSGIPIMWLQQTNWQGGDKLEIRFVFRTPVLPSTKENSELVEATLAMLMSDSLALSTASINQRLTPLAARASSYHDYESQVIGLTLSSQAQYLAPTLSLITSWLKQPVFKARTFDSWQRQYKKTSSQQDNVEHILFASPENRQSEESNAPVTLEQISQYYKSMQSSAEAIYVIGDLSEQAKQAVTESLNSISQEYRPANTTNKTFSYEPVNHIIKYNQETDQSALWQSQSAIALQPIASVKEWISLQIWGTDLVSTLNQQEHIDFVQLAFTLSPEHPWTRWNVQYAITLTTTPNKGSEEDNVILNAKSLTIAENLPSFNNKDDFESLFEAFKEQLEHQAESPTWWSYIATQVAHSDGQLTLEQFANGYKEAVDTFTITDYQNALTRLLRTSTYQEIQVYQ